MDISVKKSESLCNLGPALVKAQGSMIDPTKDAVGYGYKYAKLDQMIKIIRPILHKNGLSYTIFPGEYVDDKQSLTGILLHESGEFIEGTIQLPVERAKGMSLLQSIGSALTYGRKYLLSSVCGIQADDDIDGHVESAPVQPRKQNSPAEKPFYSMAQMDALRNELLGLVDTLKVEEAKVGSWCRKAKVSSIRELDGGQMTALISMLKEENKE
jgi:hypothetical protein